MIGLHSIGTFISKKRVSSSELAAQFGVDKNFLETKTGFVELARKAPSETAVEMCSSAFDDLLKKTKSIDLNSIDFICVCTQNQDNILPQISSVLQHKLGLQEHCATFDISLGCSGYVYGLVVAQAFMKRVGLQHGLLFTCDPYSPHLNSSDKNTQLIFGDAATASYLTSSHSLSLLHPEFATYGSKADTLSRSECGSIYMNGREIFNFSMRNVPPVINRCLKKNNLTLEELDLVILHQASLFVVNSLRKKLNVAPEKAPFLATHYGNTISSSIPLVLSNFLPDNSLKSVLLCGFGVGLSVASICLRRP
jgi:3-oxoacyl-[acyl-carrier-protein] synthase-3